MADERDDWLWIDDSPVLEAVDYAHQHGIRADDVSDEEWRKHVVVRLDANTLRAGQRRVVYAKHGTPGDPGYPHGDGGGDDGGDSSAAGGAYTDADFVAIANSQRGKPESAMRRLQETAGGGVLSFVAEHDGDLIHRMTEKYRGPHYGYELVQEKVERTLRVLDNPYGFEREHIENMQSNAEIRGISFAEHRGRVEAAQRDYAAAHRELRPLNAAQRTANRVAIRIGEGRWREASDNLHLLKHVLDQGKDAWANYAGEGLQQKRDFNPDQPRDENGRWTSGGAGGGNAEGVRAPSATPAAIDTAQTATPEFKRWFGDSKVVDEDGEPLVVYHGTAGDFSSFDVRRANPEADLGAGFYFTSGQQDVGTNYAGEGPDLTNRIESAKDRFRDEIADQNPEWTDEQVDEAAGRAARDELSVVNAGAAMPVFLKIENPVVLGGSDETRLEWSEAVDEQGEFTGEISGKAIEFTEAFKAIAQEYAPAYRNPSSVHGLDDFVTKIAEKAVDGDIGASEIYSLAKSSPELDFDLTDDQGRMVINEVVRRSFEDIGYDGIIDRTVYDKFGYGSGRGPAGGMVGINPDTVHYVVFNAKQIKSAIGNSGTFDADDPDITKHVVVRLDANTLRAGQRHGVVYTAKHGTPGDPDYPHGDGGGGAAAPKEPAAPAAAPPSGYVGPKARAAIQQFETAVRGSSIEHFKAVNENGETFYKPGTRASVTFTNEEIEKMESMQLSVYSHNHPTGNSFSPDDVAFAARIGVKELRVVADDGVFAMRMPDDVWEASKLLADVERIDGEQRSEWNNRIASNEITTDWANAHHHDELWKKVAALPQWRDTIEYSFEPRAA